MKNEKKEILNERKYEKIKTLIGCASKVSKLAKEEKETLPLFIKVISAAARGRLKETARSMILANLLQDDKLRASFIKEFIGMDTSTNKSFVSLPDKDRIDLFIKGKGFFIIIENKVNNAQEQQGQIYRYVQTAMNKYNYKSDEIYVLYLNSTDDEPPTTYSLNEDGDPEKDSALADIGSHLICKSYKQDVLKWLQKLNTNNVLEKEPYLHSALIQYIDYLEDYFEMSKKYNTMNHKIEELLKSELKLNSSTSENDLIKDCNIIDSKLNEFSELEIHLKSVKGKISILLWKGFCSMFKAECNSKHLHYLPFFLSM